MTKKYHIISTPEGKMLKPINVPYPNEDDYDDETGHEPSGAFAIADAVIYKQRCEPLPYLGTREPGTVVSEGDIKEIRQFRRLDSTNSDWQIPYDDRIWEMAVTTRGSETRTAYTDAIPEANEWRTITLKMKVDPSVPHDKITLLNSKGDTFTSKSEGLLDFLYPEYYGR